MQAGRQHGLACPACNNMPVAGGRHAFLLSGGGQGWNNRHPVAIRWGPLPPHPLPALPPLLLPFLPHPSLLEGDRWDRLTVTVGRQRDYPQKVASNHSSRNPH